MTREERLQLLKQIEKDIHVCSLESTLTDDMKSCAIRSAIEELEKEPCEDAVSRATVLALINDVKKADGFKGYSHYEYLFDQVDNMPPVTPTQKWIPVKERLPETDGEYLLFGKIDDFEDEYYKFIGEFDAAAEKFGICRDCFDPNTLGCLGSEFYEYGEVLAWMPLPDDYTEGTK
jgi:hypothetical protein